MAKAKKSETSATKSSAKKQPPTSGAPAVDTSLAAEAAAAMVGNKAATAPAAPTGAAKHESSAFKQLKQNLRNPTAASSLGNVLGHQPKNKKSNLHFGGGKQIGRNQTFGADVNRAGVPRRTPG